MRAMLRRLLAAIGVSVGSRTGNPTGYALGLALEDGQERFDLTDAPLTLGRGEQSDVVLLDESVRPTHARVTWGDGSHVLAAVRGAEVRVNGQLCERTTLSDGDAIEIGEFRLVFATAGSMPSPAEADGPRLVVLSPGGDSEFPLGKRSFTIGRAPESGLVLIDPAVAESHARVWPHDGAPVIEAINDERVVVNGELIERIGLATGDRIEIADFTLEFRA